eukprot:3863438-Rhodomonas_salina.3
MPLTTSTEGQTALGHGVRVEVTPRRLPAQAPCEGGVHQQCSRELDDALGCLVRELAQVPQHLGPRVVVAEHDREAGAAHVAVGEHQLLEGLP